MTIPEGIDLSGLGSSKAEVPPGAKEDQARGAGEAVAAKVYQLLKEGSGVKITIESAEPGSVEVVSAQPEKSH